MSKKIASIFALLAVAFVAFASPAKADPPWWAHRHHDWDHDHDAWRHRDWDHDHDWWRHRMWERNRWNGYNRTAPYYGNYQNNGYNPYAYNYSGQVPYYPGEPSLVYAQQSAQAQYNAAIARGDTNGARHYANALAKINAQLAATGYPNNSSLYFNGYTGVSPLSSLFQGFIH